MSYVSNLTIPARDHLIIVRQSLVKLTGCHIKAALLHYFDYWHCSKIQANKDAVHRNRVAERHGDYATEDESLLQWHTFDEMTEDLMGIAGKTKIKQCIAELVELGYITKHRNPNPKYKFDRTVYYLFHPEVINQAIAETTMVTQRSLATHSESSATHSESSATHGGSHSDPPIPEITSKTSSEITTDPEHNADREKPEQTYYYVDTMCGGDENFSVVGNHQQNEDHTSPTYSQTLAIAPNNFSLVTNPTSKDKVSRGFSLSREKSSPTPLDELLNQEYYLGYNNIPCDGPYRLIGPLTAQRMQWVIFHRSDAFKLLRGHDGELYVRSAFDGVLHGPEAIAKHKLKKLFQLADDSNPLHEEMGLDHHWYNEEMRTAFMFFREYVKTHNITSNFSVGQLLLEMGEIKAESMTEEDYEEFMVF